MKREKKFYVSSKLITIINITIKSKHIHIYILQINKIRIEENQIK